MFLMKFKCSLTVALPVPSGRRCLLHIHLHHPHLRRRQRRTDGERQTPNDGSQWHLELQQVKLR
jgi:hypothetical protein